MAQNKLEIRNFNIYYVNRPKMYLQNSKNVVLSDYFFFWVATQSN